MLSIDEISPLLSTLKPTAQSTLIQLWVHTVDDEVIASHADLAAWTGVKSRNTIRSAVRELLDKGWIKVVKPGQEGSPSVYRILIVGKGAVHSPPSTVPTISLTAENQLLLAAIKRSLPPAAWSVIRREASLTKESEDDVIVKRYFGPGRLNG